MATARLRFAVPYQAETPWGAALANISNAMFGGPSAASLEAARMKAREDEVDYQTKQRKLDAQQGLGDLTENATVFSKYAPGNRADPTDPNWGYKAQKAAEYYRTYPGQMASEALRGGVDVGQAANARVLTYSSPDFNDAMRSDAAVGAGKILQPYNAFSEKGQLGAERRETDSKTRVATSAAAAAHPLEYQALREREAILKGQAPGSPDRRITARLDAQRSAGEAEKERASSDLGISSTEMAQFEYAQKVAGQFKSAFGDGINMKEFEAKFPDLARTYSNVLTKIATAQASPNVQGQRQRVAASGQADWEVPSELARGQYVPAWRDPGDGQWRKQEADGKVYILRRSGR